MLMDAKGDGGWRLSEAPAGLVSDIHCQTGKAPAHAEKSMSEMVRCRGYLRPVKVYVDEIVPWDAAGMGTT